jgi:hypothetical protein
VVLGEQAERNAATAPTKRTNIAPEPVVRKTRFLFMTSPSRQR